MFLRGVSRASFGAPGMLLRISYRGLNEIPAILTLFDILYHHNTDNNHTADYQEYHEHHYNEPDAEDCTRDGSSSSMLLTIIAALFGWFIAVFLGNVVDELTVATPTSAAGHLEPPSPDLIEASCYSRRILAQTRQGRHGASQVIDGLRSSLGEPGL